MAEFTLTTSSDNFPGTASDDTVNGTAATLNSGDSLTGGLGADVLALYGGGIFYVDQLATFAGFESITLNNFTSGVAYLYLGSQSVAVTGYGPGIEQVFLGSGAVTFQGGSDLNYVFSRSPSHWNAGNSIDGGHNGSIFLNSGGSDSAAFYDLTTNTLSHISSLISNGDNVTAQINSAIAGSVANFYAAGTNTIYATNARLMTSDAMLDLSHSTVSGFRITSSNTSGTNFIVQDLGTALQVTGGAGTDTLTAGGFAFSVGQRNAIFATTSVECIVDTSGTYALVNAPPIITSNGGGDTAAVSVVENTTTVTTMTATDADAGQALRYSIIGGADASHFTIGTSTGALSFVGAPNFELPTDADGNNVYDVTVQVSDGHVIDTQAIAVTVTPVNDAPVNSLPASRFIAPNTDVAITGLAVSDVDSALLTTTLHVEHGVLNVGAVGGAAVAGSGSSTVTLTGSAAQIDAALGANNVLYHGAFDFSGIEHLTMTSNDGALSDTDILNLSVFEQVQAQTFGGIVRPTLTLDSTGHIILDPAAAEFASTYGMKALYLGMPESTPYPPVAAPDFHLV